MMWRDSGFIVVLHCWRVPTLPTQQEPNQNISLIQDVFSC